jgi:hypothetical protein
MSEKTYDDDPASKLRANQDAKGIKKVERAKGSTGGNSRTGNEYHQGEATRHLAKHHKSTGCFPAGMGMK